MGCDGEVSLEDSSGVAHMRDGEMWYSVHSPGLWLCGSYPLQFMANHSET
jgi:hypothetical protein